MLGSFLHSVLKTARPGVSPPASHGLAFQVSSVAECVEEEGSLGAGAHS